VVSNVRLIYTTGIADPQQNTIADPQSNPIADPQQNRGKVQ
jgi:hypothetical protein